MDPEESVARILQGRGGYCFHLNGTFVALLGVLGHAVTWHHGGVQGSRTALANTPRGVSQSLP
ncbi:arylamine N-acetyltransferase [Streptomyces kebangsaanensis]|uniref:Arylamine N-acetyltransferase n=1 Tax=Streptomyces kebangsaanensis TaxID=864058 RepID=A0ABW6KVE4_9ACTN